MLAMGTELVIMASNAGDKYIVINGIRYALDIVTSNATGSLTFPGTGTPNAIILKFLTNGMSGITTFAT